MQARAWRYIYHFQADTAALCCGRRQFCPDFAAVCSVARHDHEVRRPHGGRGCASSRAAACIHTANDEPCAGTAVCASFACNTKDVAL